MAQIVIMNNFDGDNTNDVGPAFQTLTNGVVIDADPVPGTFDPDTGVIMTGTSSTNATGFNNASLVTLDPATTELTATFVVASASDNTIEVRSNGWFFGLVTGASGTDPTGAGLFNNSASSIGLNLFQGTGSSNSRILTDGPVSQTDATVLFPFETEPTNVSAEDGFTFVLTLRSDGTYDASTMGLSTEVNVVNAALPEGGAPTFDDFLTGGVGLNTTAQAPSMQYIVSEVTLEATTGMVTVKGDVYRNGVVDFLDIQPFITVLATGGNQAEADVDCNGVVDFLDIQPFIGILAGAT